MLGGERGDRGFNKVRVDLFKYCEIGECFYPNSPPLTKGRNVKVLEFIGTRSQALSSDGSAHTKHGRIIYNNLRSGILSLISFCRGLGITVHTKKPDLFRGMSPTRLSHRIECMHQFPLVCGL